MAPRPGPNDPLSDDEDTIKQQLLPLLKTEDAVDDFTEDEQFTKYTGFGSKNIQISFPGFFDWLKHYDRHPSNAPARAKFSAYQRAKADAENRIKDDLKKIHSSQSGGALFKEIGRARDQTLTIAAREPKKGTDDEGPDDDDDAQNGNGTDVTIRFGSALIEPNEFTARFPWMMAPAAQRDEILFHELVHAASDMNGVTRDRHVNMFFDGESEFLAIAIANLYIVEKGQRQLRANHNFADMPLKHPEIFLDLPNIHPRPRDMLNSFRHLQGNFFDHLANIPMRPPTNYNPFKRLANERKAHDHARKAR